MDRQGPATSRTDREIFLPDHGTKVKLTETPERSEKAIGKVRDLVTKMDFETQPTHTVTYHPDQETETLSGRNGEFDVIQVLENGIPVHLSLSNQTLVRQLRAIEKPSILKITRSGTSYDTKYSVENMGPAKPKA